MRTEAAVLGLQLGSQGPWTARSGGRRLTTDLVTNSIGAGLTDRPAFPDDPLGMALFGELLNEVDDEDEDDSEEDEADDDR